MVICITVPLTEIIIFSYLFYDNLLVSAFLSPYILFWLAEYLQKKREKESLELDICFKDGIRCIKTALEAGYSIENAVGQAVPDMKLIYPEGSLIIDGFSRMKVEIATGVRVEEAFRRLSEKYPTVNIRSFSDLFSTAKRAGASLTGLIKASSELISSEMELRREIRLVLAAKQYECKVMKLMPVVVLFYLKATMNETLSVVYGTVFGKVFMTVMLILYLAIGKLADYMIARVIRL